MGKIRSKNRGPSLVPKGLGFSGDFIQFKKKNIHAFKSKTKQKNHNVELF